MSRFSITLIRLATLALLGSAGTAAYAQQNIDQASALAGGVTPGDAPGFPITISQPGHYKLTSNLVAPQGAIAIQIQVAQVTLDLNGFTVSGPNTCTQSGWAGSVVCTLPNLGKHGILAPISADGVVVRNGRVQGFQGAGVYLRGLGSEVVGVMSSLNADTGFFVYDGQIVDSRAHGNAAHGFSVTNGTLISRSLARANGGNGFQGGVVHESISLANKGYGATAAVRGVSAGNNGSGAFGPGSVSMGGNLNGGQPF